MKKTIIFNWKANVVKTEKATKENKVDKKKLEQKSTATDVKNAKNIKDAKLFTYDDISFVNKKSDDIQIRWNK